MKRRLATAVLIGVLLAGCTSTTDAIPTSTSVVSTPAASTSGASSASNTAVSSGSPTVATTEAAASSMSQTSDAQVSSSAEMSGGISAEEAADRAAIEDVWRKSWDLYTTIYDIPAADRPALVSALMVDPAAADLLNLANVSDKDGLTSYGAIVLHPHWDVTVGKKSVAAIQDCRDASHFGSVYRATGEVRSVGVKNSNTSGVFFRQDDGSWRLQQVYYLGDIACEPAE